LPLFPELLDNRTAAAEMIGSCTVVIGAAHGLARPPRGASPGRSPSAQILGARQLSPSITGGTQSTRSAPQMSSSSYSHAYRCRSLSDRPVRAPPGKPSTAGPASGAPAAEA
jgi:hypothetical protein